MVFAEKKSKIEGRRFENKDKTTNKLYGYYVYMTSDYFDFQANNQSDMQKIKGYTMQVQNADGSLIDQYRTQPLNERELNTYAKIDSVGEKYKLDNKVKFFVALSRGNIRSEKVDFGIGDFVKYNQYEGIRVGISAKTYEKF